MPATNAARIPMVKLNIKNDPKRPRILQDKYQINTNNNFSFLGTKSDRNEKLKKNIYRLSAISATKSGIQMYMPPPVVPASKRPM